MGLASRWCGCSGSDEWIDEDGADEFRCEKVRPPPGRPLADKGPEDQRRRRAVGDRGGEGRRRGRVGPEVREGGWGRRRDPLGKKVE